MARSPVNTIRCPASQQGGGVPCSHWLQLLQQLGERNGPRRTRSSWWRYWAIASWSPGSFCGFRMQLSALSMHWASSGNLSLRFSSRKFMKLSFKAPKWALWSTCVMTVSLYFTSPPPWILSMAPWRVGRLYCASASRIVVRVVLTVSMAAVADQKSNASLWNTFHNRAKSGKTSAMRHVSAMNVYWWSFISNPLTAALPLPASLLSVMISAGQQFRIAWTAWSRESQRMAWGCFNTMSVSSLSNS